MSKEKKNPVGRPTKYTDDMPEKLISYFSCFETFIFMDKEFPKIKTKAGFCSEVAKVAKSTFDDWVMKNEKFRVAWEQCKTMQEHMIHTFTANRIIDGNYGKLLAVNCTDLKDKVETTNTNKEIRINIDKEDSEL